MGVAVYDGLAVWWIEPKFMDSHPEFHEATLTWIRSLGLVPDRLAPTAGVVPWRGAYELHVDEIVHDPETGYDRFDPLAPNELLTIRRIIPVASGSWPAMPAEVAV